MKEHSLDYLNESDWYDFNPSLAPFCILFEWNIIEHLKDHVVDFWAFWQV